MWGIIVIMIICRCGADRGERIGSGPVLLKFRMIRGGGGWGLVLSGGEGRLTLPGYVAIVG